MIKMDHLHGSPRMNVSDCQSMLVLGDEGSSNVHLNSLLCSLALLKNKVNDVDSVVTSSSSSASMSLAGLGTLIQEIIVTASSMMFNCQQMALGSPSVTAATTTSNNNNNTSPVLYGYDHHPQNGNGSQYQALNNKLATKSSDEYISCIDTTESRRGADQGQASTTFLPNDDPSFYWYTYNNNTNDITPIATTTTGVIINSIAPESATTCNIIEIDASELLAKYTHYCQVCGKGFKRDANLRMHMRAHGDEYKSSAALSNPLKSLIKADTTGPHDPTNPTTTPTSQKYSCPQEGCRWNKRHAKFQPLKSMICVKNHYKRSHCPKMYVCNRCNRKQFSVLSDLKTHEKHCGDLRWRCSCGTTFSRKDKLMGHVTLFVGHSPIGVPYGNNTTASHVGPT